MSRSPFKTSRPARLRQNLGRVSAFALLFVAQSVPEPAFARVATTAADVCAAHEDPCLVDEAFEVSAQTPLDFGLRTVRVTGSGRFTGTLLLFCGTFESEVIDRRWMEIPSRREGPELRIVARKGCSLTPGYACSDDQDCEEVELGTCSMGEGRVKIESGDVAGRGADIRIEARGAISIGGRIRAPAWPDESEVGSIEIESTDDGVEIDGTLNVNGGYDTEYDSPGYAGSIRVRAARNISMRGRVLAAGGGATVEVSSGGSVEFLGSLLARGARGSGNYGGRLAIIAAEDVELLPRFPSVTQKIDVRGGYYRDAYSVEGYPGGSVLLEAGRTLYIGEGVDFRGDSGLSRGPTDDLPYGAEFELRAGATLFFDGLLSARGRGRYGRSELVSLSAEENLLIGPHAKITMDAYDSGTLDLYTPPTGYVSLDGAISLDGIGDDKEPGEYGYGGQVFLSGGTVKLGGHVRSGGASSGDDHYITACRLHLTPTARMDLSLGEQLDDPVGMGIEIGESMFAEAGSVVVGKDDAEIEIAYRDELKPPRLEGAFHPAPSLQLVPYLAGCPVCGNFEVDEGEGCDDGNTTAGDGCDADCASEGDLLPELP